MTSASSDRNKIEKMKKDRKAAMRSGIAPKNAADALKYEICKLFVKSRGALNITRVDMAKRLKITEDELKYILFYRTDFLTLDLLVHNLFELLKIDQSLYDSIKKTLDLSEITSTMDMVLEVKTQIANNILVCKRENYEWILGKEESNNLKELKLKSFNLDHLVWVLEVVKKYDKKLEEFTNELINNKTSDPEDRERGNRSLEEEFKLELCGIIKVARYKQQKLSAKQFADSLGVDTATMSKIGKFKVTEVSVTSLLAVVEKIHKVYGGLERTINRLKNVA